MTDIRNAYIRASHTQHQAPTYQLSLVVLFRDLFPSPSMDSRASSSGYFSQTKRRKYAKRNTKRKTYSKKKSGRTPYSRPSAAYSTNIIHADFASQKSKLVVFRKTDILTQVPGTLSNDPNPKFGAISFRLQDFIASSAAGAYDSYCICWAKITFTRLAAVQDDNTGTEAAVILHIAPDFDDNNPPTATNQVVMRPYYKMIPISDADKPTSVTIQPKCTSVVAVYNGTTALAPAINKGVTWLNTSEAGLQVVHCGFKYAIEQYTQAALNANATVPVGIHMITEIGVRLRGEVLP